MRVVEVRSGGTQLGVEVDERNVVVRIRPGSVAERKLRLGDEILALDETELVTLTLTPTLILTLTPTLILTLTPTLTLTLTPTLTLTLALTLT